MEQNKPILWALIFILLFASCTNTTKSQKNSQTNGSSLWFSNNNFALNAKSTLPKNICIKEESPTFNIIRNEFKKEKPDFGTKSSKIQKDNTQNALIIGTGATPEIQKQVKADEIASLEHDGFIIRSIPKSKSIVIAANTDIGALYGTFEFLRLIKTTNFSLASLNITEIPSYQHRLLNHWDNLDGTIERGYAGHSLWKWQQLPDTLSPRYAEYAKANASIGINGTVLNNVNARPEILTARYLEKVKALANVFRPYGIRVYLSINFSSPKILGGLKNSDPLNPEVKLWWKEKTKEIYKLIPNFGGFLVKANSEGLPGPQDYGRTHADGANMLADALAPYGGIVMWRAFVYNPSGNDRAMQAYNEFLPLDGKFRKNVIIQVKNGPIDFQPREPFSPLFGAMKHTTLMPELQITKEYLGFNNHLAFLATLFSECLDSDTYAEGKNTTVAKITDGSVFNDSITAIAGVANIGKDANWCGSNFCQANWYAFGRLAWNNKLTPKQIAEEWIKQTFTTDNEFVDTVTNIMMQSREAVVNYMTPMGLHHLMGWDHHYGPEPWCKIPEARPDWLPTYYHRANAYGIGFDRSLQGSKAVAQYYEPLKSIYDNPEACPENLLLWFHHLSWNYKMKNGNTLWDELCYKYTSGVKQVQKFQTEWDKMEGKIDQQRFHEEQKNLATQAKEAMWWRDACLLYFQTFSKMEIPKELERPTHKLNELKKTKFEMGNHN